MHGQYSFWIWVVRELNGNVDIRGFRIQKKIIFHLSAYPYLHFPNISFDMFSIKVIYFYLEKQTQTGIFNTNKENRPSKTPKRSPKTRRTHSKTQKKPTETQKKPKNENPVQYFDFKWTPGNHKCVSSNEKWPQMTSIRMLKISMDIL